LTALAKESYTGKAAETLFFIMVKISFSCPGRMLGSITIAIGLGDASTSTIREAFLYPG
jgi:hypothetical protein